VLQNLLVLGIALMRHAPAAQDRSLATGLAIVVSYAYPYGELIYLRWVPGEPAWPIAGLVTVTAAACPRFVDFVERGITSGRQVLGLAEGYLEPLQRAEVDTLVLGCTHYPMLSGLIQLAIGEHVTLVSSAEETAKDLLRVLTERDLLHPHPDDPAAAVRRRFEATGDPEAFTTLAARFLGPTLDGVDPVQRHVEVKK